MILSGSGQWVTLLRFEWEWGHCLDTLLDETDANIKKRASAQRQKQNGFYQAYVTWSMGTTPLQVMQVENALKREQPGLLNTDPEAFYRQLLERAGVLPT